MVGRFNLVSGFHSKVRQPGECSTRACTQVFLSIVQCGPTISFGHRFVCLFQGDGAAPVCRFYPGEYA